MSSMGRAPGSSGSPFLTQAQAATLFQPLDGDLTAVAALDAATPGVLATDGAGWLRKTYAQLKAALGITTGDVAGLGTIATHPTTDFLTPAQGNASYVASADGATFTWNGTPVPVGPGLLTAANSWTGQQTFNKFPWVHAASGENVVQGRTATDGLTTPWNIQHDGISGDLFHLTTGPNTTTSRTVTDGVTTSGSAIVTSATALFTPGPLSSGVGTDIGKTISGTGIPAGTSIATLINTTVTVGSNGAVLPQATINVADTTNFAAAGTATIVLAGGVTTAIAYTGKTGTTLTGCTGGSGTLATSQTVYSGEAALMSANATASGSGVTLTLGTGPNANGAVIAIGVDNAGTGIITRNKYKGIALQVDHLSTVASSGSYGLFVQNQAPSTAGPAVRIFQSGGATALQFDSSTAPAGSLAMKLNDNGVGGNVLSGQIGADLGMIDWRRTIQTFAPNSSGTPLVRVADEADSPSGLGTETFLTAKTTGGTFSGFAGVYFRRNTTGNNANTAIFAGRIGMDTTNADRLSFEVANGSTTRGSETYRKIIAMRGSTGSTGGLAFFGVTPVAQPSALTQTYATATRTHANPTAAAVATTASTTTTPFGYTTSAQADAIVTAVNALVADMANVKQFVNTLADDLQAYGLEA